LPFLGRCRLPIVLTDDEIQRLVDEPKRLPEDYGFKLSRFKTQKKNRKSSLLVLGDSGGEFEIHVRVSTEDRLNFSVILVYRLPKSSRRFILRRYNGHSHAHTNRIEGDSILLKPHIHYATERYQKSGFSEEQFAEVSESYSTWREALAAMIKGRGFVEPNGDDLQMRIDI
jgi:hypothetical protein